MALKKKVCRKCLAKEYGFEGEEKNGKLSCYPPLKGSDAQEFFAQFEKEWSQDRVWCLGYNDADLAETPLTSDGCFCSFVYTKGNIPPVCRFKKGQMNGGFLPSHTLKLIKDELKQKNKGEIK